MVNKKINRTVSVLPLFLFLSMVCWTENSQLVELCAKIREGDEKAVRSMIDKNHELVNEIDYDASSRRIYNCLIEAMSIGNIKLFDLLIQNDANVNLEIPNSGGLGIGSYAAIKNNPHFINGLIVHGLDIEKITDKGKSFLNFAAEFGNREIIDELYGKMKSIEKLKKQNDENAIIFSAIDSGEVDTVDYVINKGFEVLAVNKLGLNPIEYIMQIDQITIQNAQMITSLVKKNDKLVIGRNIAIRCVKDNWKGISLLATIQHNNIDVLNEKDENGNTILVYLLRERKYQVIKALMENGLRFKNFNSENLSMNDYLRKVLNWKDEEIDVFWKKVDWTN